MADIFPGPDGDFDTMVANFITVVNAALTSYALVLGDMTPVTTAKTDWDTKYAAHIAAQANAQSKAAAKGVSRAGLEAAIRVVINKIQGAGSAVTAASKEAAGIHVRDTILTPVGVPTTRPVGQADTSQRLRHTVSFRDEATPTSKAKPAGVRGCELFVKIGGAAPSDPSECTYIATDTNSPYLYTFDGDQAGQMAHWMLRWVNTKGEPGPWSETVSATVPG